jgi:hypothetical protein
MRPVQAFDEQSDHDPELVVLPAAQRPPARDAGPEGPRTESALTASFFEIASASLLMVVFLIALSTVSNVVRSWQPEAGHLIGHATTALVVPEDV